MRQTFNKAINQGTEEAAQEAFNTITRNLVAQGLYDPDRGAFTDAAGDASAGFTAGALGQLIVGLVAGGKRGRARLQQRRQEQDQLAARAMSEQAAPTPGVRSVDEMEANLLAADSTATVPSRDVRVPFISETDNLNRGRSAVDIALATRGSVPAAIFQSDVGEITFDFGTGGDPRRQFRGGWGLFHILAKRNSEGLDGERFVREDLPEIIARGSLDRFYGPSNARRADITFRGKRVTLSLFRNGERENWVLTGFDENVEPR